ncbi:hypothetical protein OKW29_000227 [Paraburkholderia sp. CI3]
MDILTADFSRLQAMLRIVEQALQCFRVVSRACAARRVDTTRVSLSGSAVLSLLRQGVSDEGDQRTRI